MQKLQVLSMEASFLFLLLLLVSFILISSSTSLLGDNKIVAAKQVWENIGESFFKKQSKLQVISVLYSLMFLILFTLNLSGLIPNFVTFTTQLMVMFPLALLCWGTSFASSLFFNSKFFFSNMIPSGISLLLAPLLSLVEMLSHFLRPLTLSVRISANMTVGHVILGLIIISFMTKFLAGFLLACVLLLIWLLYLSVEVAISFIQGGVFAMLGILYTTEHA